MVIGCEYEYKDTKNESNSQHFGRGCSQRKVVSMSTKIQKMKAIHNSVYSLIP